MSGQGWIHFRLLSKTRLQLYISRYVQLHGLLFSPYSNTDSSLAVRKVVEFALTLRASSFLNAVPLLKLKNRIILSRRMNPVQYMK